MIPAQLRSGDTWKWDESAPVLPDPDGTEATSTTWTMKYEFQGPTKFTVTGTADNTDFTFAVTSATSKTYTAGVYRWIQYVIKTADSSERYTVGSGIVELLPDLATVVGGYDGRTHAQRMVDLLEASIEKLATDAIQELEIAGRRYVKADIATLRSMLNQYRNEADEASSGKKRKILYAFRTTT